MDSYEKKYKEALQRAKEICATLSDKAMSEYIFPELKESEDERIRKELLEFLDELSKLGKNTNFDRWSKSDCADWICWLEKQGETYTKKDIDNAYLEGMAFAKDELEKQNKQILANSAKTCKDEQKPTDEEIKTLLRTEYEKGRADAIAEMQKAWSEEDEEELDIAISTLKEAGQHDSAKWLKSLKERCTWTRTDAFVDEACEFLRNNIDKQLIIYHEQTWCKRDEFIKKFCKYMRGE